MDELTAKCIRPFYITYHNTHHKQTSHPFSEQGIRVLILIMGEFIKVCQTESYVRFKLK